MGGALAVYLRQQNSPFAVTAAEGALVGLIAGLIGGVVGTILSIPIAGMMGPFQQRLVDGILSRPDFPAEAREMIERATRGSGGSAPRDRAPIRVDDRDRRHLRDAGRTARNRDVQKGTRRLRRRGTVDILPPE